MAPPVVKGARVHFQDPEKDTDTQFAISTSTESMIFGIIFSFVVEEYFYAYNL